MVDRIGNCRILGEIGSGGMAVVYKAVQEPLGRIVALKALKPSIAVDSQFAQRFEREALFMASLQHENILHVLDFVKSGRSMYIVLEYIEGIDVYDLLEHSPRLPVEVATIIALQVARALDYAHFRGIIHRDIKPANIMVSRQGQVKLMDFGIARDDRLSDLTETGTGLGTPSYMSPEQILGDKLDFRSDIFSLGIVLYQMLTGSKPFIEDETRTVMQKIRLDRYVSPRRLNPAVPRHLERILARCMEKMPSNRYATTQALIDDMVEFLASRVTMNYNARIVIYLRDAGLLTEEQADSVLKTSESRALRTQGDQSMLRQVFVVQSILLAGVLAGGGVIQANAGRFDASQQSRFRPVGELARTEDAGFLRVVANPWADVYIDGQKILTTPSARRIPLAPGRHYVKFKNPYCKELDREIRVVSGKSQVLDVDLELLEAKPRDEARTRDEGRTKDEGKPKDEGRTKEQGKR